MNIEQAIEWEAGGPAELTDDARAWILSRPKCVQELIKRFPIACIVEATIPLHIPCPGVYGFVSGYRESGEIHVDVEVEPGVLVRGTCKPEWLRVVGYRGVFTHELMERALTEGVG